MGWQALWPLEQEGSVEEGTSSRVHTLGSNKSEENARETEEQGPNVGQAQP